ncbi:glycosyltransferase family 4 protein [Tuberibacillus sp. Marseille-P3662]|uniref:glycosyltransferase family 4 protein n=1 Tax=Tuberibacillus sp. Marseille-P3662 TaxID=1965358 RepID=UPI000A1CC53A|nr:glycosyltransferase family 4 protein [Tuberibacillus sp. Marseille-P3662]
MKVCHITSVHIYNDTRIFVKECQSLAQHYETHLVAPDAPDKTIEGIHCHGVLKSGSNRLSRMTSTVRSVFKKALEVDADVYHFHDPELIFSGMMLKKRGKKVFYDVHEDVPKQILSKDWLPNVLKKPLGLMTRNLEAFASKKFDGIVTATPEITERFEAYNDQTITVQNFPLLDEWEQEDNNNAQTFDNKAAYIGSITKPRGILEIIQAFGKINGGTNENVRLLLGGKFGTPELENKAQQLNGWQYVDFLGWLGRNEVREVLNQAKVGLVLIHPEPRYKVSYPVKMFEYMSAGIPVVASDFPLWKGIVEHNECGICVDPLDPSAIADAIQFILDHPEQAKKMGQNGRHAVTEKYSWEPEFKKLLESYQKISR